MAASDAFYLATKLEVDEVLAEFGTTYSVRTPGVYDPATLETSAGATRAIIGLVADQREVSITAGSALVPAPESSGGWISKKVLIFSADAQPAAGEDVQVDGIWFPLSKSVPIKPADVVVVYMLDIAR